MHTCNPSIWEAKFQDSKFKDSLGYTVMENVSKTTKMKWNEIKQQWNNWGKCD